MPGEAQTSLANGRFVPRIRKRARGAVRVATIPFIASSASPSVRAAAASVNFTFIGSPACPAIALQSRRKFASPSSLRQVDKLTHCKVKNPGGGLTSSKSTGKSTPLCLEYMASSITQKLRTEFLVHNTTVQAAAASSSAIFWCQFSAGWMSPSQKTDQPNRLSALTNVSTVGLSMLE